MDSLHRKKRCLNITSEQKTLLTEYINKHPELLKGKLTSFTSSFTLKRFHTFMEWNKWNFKFG